jgi:hypothetical protein
MLAHQPQTQANIALVAEEPERTFAASVTSRLRNIRMNPENKALAERYRDMGEEARIGAETALSSELYKSNLDLARKWHTLAFETEHLP